MIKRLTISGLVLMASAASAMAHTGVGGTDGIIHGFMHPVGGLDHVLAMVAVGLFASILGGRALWLVPASFVLAMVAGGLLGMGGTELPFVEVGIALSVIVLGLVVALQWKAPIAVAMALCAGFAIFHGLAHGAEMPVDASGLQYAAGFVAATALLHAIGLAIGLGIARLAPRMAIVKAAGGAVAAAGVGLTFGWL